MKKYTVINVNKKLNGFVYCYKYKVNIHHSCFNQAKFTNVRFRSGNITNTNFRNVNFKNCDFIGVNLKKTNFKNANLNNVLFYNCNLSYCNFENANLMNVIFINCKIKNTIGNEIANSFFHKLPSFIELENLYVNLVSNKKLEKYNILTTVDGKINTYLLSSLYEKFGDVILNILAKFSKNNKKQFYSYFNYVESILDYLKM